MGVIEFKCHFCNRILSLLENRYNLARIVKGKSFGVYFCPECFERVAGKEYVELFTLEAEKQ